MPAFKILFSFPICDQMYLGRLFERTQHIKLDETLCALHQLGAFAEGLFDLVFHDILNGESADVCDHNHEDRSFVQRIELMIVMSYVGPLSDAFPPWVLDTEPVVPYMPRRSGIEERPFKSLSRGRWSVTPLEL